MNRYSAWKYVLISVALFVGIVYTLPNFFPEVPAVQVSTSKANIKIDNSTLQTVEGALKAANIAYRGETIDPTGIKVRFADGDTRLKAKDVLQQKLGDDYIVALNQVSSSPRWLASRITSARPTASPPATFALAAFRRRCQFGSAGDSAPPRVCAIPAISASVDTGRMHSTARSIGKVTDRPPVANSTTTLFCVSAESDTVPGYSTKLG